MLLGQNTRNGFINAHFPIAQRASSLALNTNAGYVVDRWTWRTNADGGTLATGTISKQAVNNSHPFFIDQENFVRIQNTSQGSSLGTNSYAFFCQYIEGVQRFAGKRVTVSIWAESTIPNKVLNVNFAQGFGSGGSATVVGGQQITLLGNTTLTRYDVTLDIPSIVGKVIGTGSYLAIYIECQAGLARSALAGISQAVSWQANGNIDFYRLQINEGPAADFEPASSWNRGLEELYCGRFFEKSYGATVNPGTATQGGELSGYVTGSVPNASYLQFSKTFAVKKRINPLVTPYASLVASSPGTIYVQAAARLATIVDISDAGFGAIRNDSGVTWNNGEQLIFQYTADAEF